MRDNRVDVWPAAAGRPGQAREQMRHRQARQPRSATNDRAAARIQPVPCTHRAAASLRGAPPVARTKTSAAGGGRSVPKSYYNVGYPQVHRSYQSSSFRLYVRTPVRPRPCGELGSSRTLWRLSTERQLVRKQPFQHDTRVSSSYLCAICNVGDGEEPQEMRQTAASASNYWT